MSNESMRGACIVCGKTDYPLSFGGPAICPSCDCGIDPKLSHANDRIKELEKTIDDREYAFQNAQHESLRENLKLKARIEEAVEVIKKAKLGLHEANLERNAPIFAWPLKDCEEFLARHTQQGEGK